MTSTTSPETGSHQGTDVPLVALLGRAQAAFAAEFDRRVAATEFCALSLAHSRNVLRHLGGGPLRATQLVALCGLSKQAVSQQLVQLERAGYITVTPDPADQRARVIALTERGVRAQCLVHRLFVEIEQEWAVRLGHQQLADVRRTLEGLLGDDPSCAGDSTC